MTDPSLTTIFAGKHPLNHGVINHGEKVTPVEISNAMKFYSLPIILAQKGYLTLAVDFLERWHKRGFHRYASTHEKVIISKVLHQLSTLIYFMKGEYFSAS